jgi:hypothetical protein
MFGLADTSGKDSPITDDLSLDNRDAVGAWHDEREGLYKAGGREWGGRSVAG